MKKEKNPFEVRRVDHKKCPRKMLDLRTTLELILGTRPIGSFSKRLLPAMAISNARIYMTAKDTQSGYRAIWKGDLDFHTTYRAIARVADFYQVTLHVFTESGQQPEWTSVLPEEWLGWAPDALRKLKGILPLEVSDVYPSYKRMAEESREQWMKDHGFSFPRPSKARAAKTPRSSRV